MSIAEMTAAYLAQAVFWVWLQREAMRDRPRGDPLAGKSLAASLWRFDARATRNTAWAFLFISTIAYVTAVVISLAAER